MLESRERRPRAPLLQPQQDAAEDGRQGQARRHRSAQEEVWRRVSIIWCGQDG